MFSEFTSCKSLEPNAVHLWFASTYLLEHDNKTLDHCKELLSNEELRAANKIPNSSSQLEYILSHGMLRKALSCYADVEPQEWLYAKNDAGKPVLHEKHKAYNLRFNVSTSPGMVALAISRGGEVGVDIEHHSRWGAPVADANHYFSELELASLRNRPIADRDRLFYRYWTLKESWIKACGIGQAVKLDSFSFGMGASGHIHFVPPGDDETERKRWDFRVFNPSEDYTVALAAEAPLEQLVILRATDHDTVEQFSFDEFSSAMSSYANG